MTEKFTILIPVYNDWAALQKLLALISEQARHLAMEFDVLLMNDCSAEPVDVQVMEHLHIHVVNLLRNVGHQKAIAIGLAHLAHGAATNVIVMDADGEDKPTDIPTLIAKAKDTPGKIVFAERSKRSEGLVFRTFYVIYRWAFKLLTGQTITFGNYSIVPAEKLRNLAFVSEIWNNYPGGVIRSKLPYTSVPLERGHRLAGKSKMNFVSLVLHGMSAIAVFLDSTAVRIMLFMLFLIACSLGGIAVVFMLKFVANMASPGWASSLGSAFFIIVLQGFFISLFLVFTVLSYRSNRYFIPLTDYKQFIDSIDQIA